MSTPRQTLLQILQENRRSDPRWRGESMPPFNHRSINGTSGEYVFRIQPGLLHRNMSVVDLLSAERNLKQLFLRILRASYIDQGGRMRPNTRMQVLVDDGSHFIQTAVMYYARIKPSAIFDLIMNTLQSDESLRLDNLTVTVKIFHAVQGGALSIWDTLTFDEFIKKKRCCVNIISNENDCFFQCLALTLSDHRDELIKGRQALQRRQAEAQRLRDHVNETAFRCVKGEAVNLGDMDTFEEIFQVRIMIILFESLKTIRVSKNNYEKLCVLLMHEVSPGLYHYSWVNPTRVGALWGRPNFCFACSRSLTTIAHRCVATCHACCMPDCEGVSKAFPQEFKVKCPQCAKLFFNQACVDKHIASRNCGNSIWCHDCQFSYYKNMDHQCGFKTCTICGASDIPQEADHDCYHQPLTNEELKAPSTKYIFYDYESFITDDTLLHNCAGVVAMSFDDPTPQRFETNEAFCKWVFTKKHTEYTFIAHNGGRYDMHFIKQFLCTTPIQTFDLVNGSGYIYIEAKKLKIRFIDSYRFISIPLRSFPKTFGITELAKGYFPYRFFTPENKHYSGPLPAIEHFDFDGLKPKERTAALQWYSEHKEDIIEDLYETCMVYCESDVALLREGCIRFRQLFLDITNQEIDPFQNLTIASVCQLIYRRFHLTPQSIAVFKAPTDVDFFREEWRDSMRRSQKVSHPDPLTIADIECDAYNEPTKTCYFFLGCYDNGCERCFSRYTRHVSRCLYMCQLRNSLTEKTNTLKAQGYKVVMYWRCNYIRYRPKNYGSSDEYWEGGELSWAREFGGVPIYEEEGSDSDDDHDDLLEEDPENFYANSRAAQEKLNGSIHKLVMRDAFFGGRTEPIKLYYKCKPGEKIRYYDYTSLYPSVQYGVFHGLTSETYQTKRYVDYPVGHYTIIKGPHLPQPLETYFGFIKCKVVPPDIDDLYLPVLPVRGDGKLVFDLTTKIGTWTILEVLEAQKQGYRIEEIFEIYHFEQQSNDLFKSYVRTFLKMKQEAAGWDKLGCTTDEEKEAMIIDYERVMGIHLERDKIQENPGLYFIAKLCLNSLWGKFGQRVSFMSTETTYDEGSFQKLIQNDFNEVCNVTFISESVRVVSFKRKSEIQVVPRKTNIAIAAFTTAHARLRLYEALNILKEDVLYMDTDSVLFIERDNQPRLCTGPYLGDLTDELPEDDHIVEFVSTGPKSYAYVTAKGKTECKVKGFTLNYETSTNLNMEAMKTMVLAPEEEKVVMTRPFQIIVDHMHQMRSKDWGENGKKFKLTFNKRSIHAVDEGCVDSRPFKKQCS